METDVMELPRRANKLLNIIRSWSGEWVTHTDIVKSLNAASRSTTRERKTRYLSAVDHAHLKTLMFAGKIEGVKEEVDTPIGYRWKYRAIKQES